MTIESTLFSIFAFEVGAVFSNVAIRVAPTSSDPKLEKMRDFESKRKL